jgi:hypothetical protein
MRVYQLRHYEVMMRDEGEEVRHLLYYEQLCYDLLTIHAISTSRTVEIIKLNHGRIEQRPLKILALLSATKLSPFHFIVTKN